MAVSMLRMTHSSMSDNDDMNGARWSSRTTAVATSPAFFDMNSVLRMDSWRFRKDFNRAFACPVLWKGVLDVLVTQLDRH